jgi:hypothetical protein
MSKTDMEWVKQQMTAAKVKQSVGTSVLRLMEVWETMNHNKNTAKDTVEIFGKLALGHAIASSETEDFSGTWIPAQPGQIKVADIVRIKSDAFDGDLGRAHNGRLGRVVGVRYGDVIVKTIDDRVPELSGAHYSPHMLEKLVK